MNITPTRLTVVMTHPAQYYAPWFRYIHQSCPDLSLHVLYATQPTAAQQGVGFGTEFAWDVPLTEGYACEVVRAPHPNINVHSSRFRGVDVPEIVEALRNSRPDVVMVAGWHSITQLRVIRACHRRGIPLLYRGDSNLNSTPAGALKRTLWRARTRWLLRHFSGYLSVGEEARRYLLTLGVPAVRIFSSPHCVDNDFFATAAAKHQTPDGRWAARAAFGLAPNDFVVLFAGKLEHVKRPLDAVRAVAGLGSQAALLAVGDGPLRDECQREAHSLGVRAAWAGFVNQSQIAQAYAAADCLVLPSASETWGLVVNEALATGLPCVVSDQVGCAADLIISGETGESYAVGNIPELTAALARMREQSRQDDRAAKCRQVAARHSFAAATEGLRAACQAMRLAHTPKPSARQSDERRIIACCGQMAMVSGLERMTFEVLGVMRQQGATVHCILNEWANVDRYKTQHPILKLAIDIDATWSTGRYRTGLNRHTRNPFQWARFAWDIALTSAGLARDAGRFRPTHVLLSDFTAVIRNAPALAWLRARRTPVILRIGNAPPAGPFYQRLFRRLINPLVSQIVCNSEYVGRELLGLGVPEAKIRVIRNSLSAAVINAAPLRNGCADPRKVLYVGQIIPEKGVDILLDAVGILARGGQDVRLDIVGGPLDGWVSPTYAGYREKLFARAQLPDLAGRVRFLGERSDVPALMAKAAVHACPSRPEMGEGLPNVVLEAKHAELPTVAFAVGPFPELIDHGRDGWLCREVGPEELADGLSQLLTPELRDSAGLAARQSLARFSRERFVREWTEVFR